MSAPSAAQMSAVESYAEWAGIDWKRRLVEDWMRAGSWWPGQWGHLQQLRNSHGVEWLDGFDIDEWLEASS